VVRTGDAGRLASVERFFGGCVYTGATVSIALPFEVLLTLVNVASDKGSEWRTGTSPVVRHERLGGCAARRCGDGCGLQAGLERGMMSGRSAGIISRC